MMLPPPPPPPQSFRDIDDDRIIIASILNAVSLRLTRKKFVLKWRMKNLMGIKVLYSFVERVG